MQHFDFLNIIFETKSGINGVVQVNLSGSITVEFDENDPRLTPDDHKEIGKAIDNAQRCLKAVMDAKRDTE